MKIEEILKTKEDLLLYFRGELDEITQFRNELNRDHAEQAIAVIKEKRVFFQNILLASATILGIASVFSSLSSNSTTHIYSPYLFTGLGLHLGVICIVVMYLREILDQELQGITDNQDRYNKIIQMKILLTEKYASTVAGASQLVIGETLRSYFKELETDPLSLSLERENNFYHEQREDRISGRTYLEFYGEIISFFFITGSAFIILAISGRQFSTKIILIGLLFFFLISFTDFLTKRTKWLFRVLTFLRKDIKNVF